MATEFSREFFSENRIVKADLRAAHQLREEDIARIKAEVKKLYDATEVILNVSVDESLLSGYVLQVGDRVFDNSGRHQLDQMMAGKPSLATLKTRIEDYKPAQTSAEGGVVISSADGIVQVEGMDKAVYGEIVTFENGAKGMVESVDPGKLGIMLFDGAETVGVGTLVTRSGKRAGIPVGDGFLGRVIDPLGEPIDGKGPVNAEGYNPIEKQAPGILERQSVDTPLHTGILAIDSMFPIGRGQRELIIGDRQTGKTSIATDAILNQKDTGVLCIYVAIGQKASSIARVAEDLKKHGAMSYTTIVAATASDSAPLQYIAPYAGTALAEYFMSKGKSVLIVYDDLSKHAVAYRAISLLLRRSPGREAYPGDVFYLHSRLLERSCRMRDDLGGGSITALPIVETQAGDVSAYIPTNVISITDGQIFLESALFNAGNRPAVNVGLSVSRVGGAAQTKAMKKANSNLRIELAQYKDMESFAQFSSDLDAETRRQLEHGKALTEMLKQPLYQPKPFDLEEPLHAPHAAVRQPQQTRPRAQRPRRELARSGLLRPHRARSGGRGPHGASAPRRAPRARLGRPGPGRARPSVPRPRIQHRRESLPQPDGPSARGAPAPGDVRAGCDGPDHVGPRVRPLGRGRVRPPQALDRRSQGARLPREPLHGPGPRDDGEGEGIGRRPRRTLHRSLGGRGRDARGGRRARGLCLLRRGRH